MPGKKHQVDYRNALAESAFEDPPTADAARRQPSGDELPAPAVLRKYVSRLRTSVGNTGRNG